MVKKSERAHTRASLRAILASFLGVLALALAGGLARAQAPADVPVEGEWRLAISEEEARSRIERGIAAATEGLPPIADGIAARMLRERTPPIERVHVATTPSRIVVQLDQRRYESAPGMPQSRQSGEDRIQVVQHFREGALEQVFETPRGTRWNTFRVGDGGDTMTLEVVIESSRLPEALRFSLPYRAAR